MVLFDMIYVDGEHTFEQAYRDLVNSINHLSKWGVVLLDDTVPKDSIAAIPSEAESKIASLRVHGTDTWTHQGDVWKLILQVNEFHKDLTVRTVLGPSRPRTLMWRNRSFGTIMDCVPSPQLEQLTYEAAFSQGIPTEFGVSDLANILTELQNRDLGN